MKSNLLQLIEAEKKAKLLFKEIENNNLIIAGKTEKELNNEIFELAFEMFGIKKYWHKRIVRSGENTLKPYNENPKDLIIQKDDILFFDFGPIFEDWEADFGRTFVIGNDEIKIKLKNDLEKVWTDCKDYYFNTKSIKGNALYDFAVLSAKRYGWEFGGEIAGHIIGHFPHESLDKEDKTNYIHPENKTKMNSLNQKNEKKEWILEIHLINKELKIGGFFEQLLIKS